MTQDGAEVLFDQIGDSRKFQISLDELLVFIKKDNSLVWEYFDVEPYPGLKAIKECDKLGYVAVWVENEGKHPIKNKQILTILLSW
jgi:hypothetical protein